MRVALTGALALVFAFAVVAVGASGANVTFNLFGSQNGWGASSGTITNPGPTLSPTQGDNVTLILHSADGIQHNWFIDTNANTIRDAGEIFAPDVDEGNITRTFSFTAPTAGQYTYRCQYHPTSMTGVLSVQPPGGTQPAAGLDLMVILLIVLAVVVVGAVAAVVARRRKKA